MKKILSLFGLRKKLSPKERYFNQIQHEIRLLEKQEIELKRKIELLEGQVQELKQSRSNDINAIKKKLIKMAIQAVRKHKDHLDHEYQREHGRG